MASDDKYHADLGIIGGGVGGLGCAIIAAYKGLKVSVFEGGRLGGIVTTLYARKLVENYPGTPSILAKRLIDEFVIQSQEVDAEIITERVVKVTKEEDDVITVITNEGTYNFRSLVIATGSKPAELGVPGENKFKRKDRGLYNFVTDPDRFKGATVAVIGGGDTAIDAVRTISGLAKKIYLVHRRDSFRAAETTVQEIIDNNLAEIVYKHQLKELKGEDNLQQVVLEHAETKEERIIEADKCVLAIGLKTSVEIFEDIGLKTDGKYIIVDREMRTNVPGVFAIGDIASKYQLIVIAVAQGAIAAHNAFGMIRKPYWFKKEDAEWPTEVC
ncbi:MAG: NAD(P)/FAD-dependent oxidoreductase [Candidatus Heimdallarchaeaceae archaeon]